MGPTKADPRVPHPTQLASIVVVLRDAVAGHSDGPQAAFPDSAYLASYVGVLLYFLAGLLPDPEGPWSPVAANGHAWVTGVLLEAVIAAVLKTQQPAIGLSRDVVDTLLSLGLARLAVFVVMISLMALRQYKLRSSESQSAPEERQSLLGNGQNGQNGQNSQGLVADYGGVHGAHAHMPAIKPASGKPPGVQGTGWLDYFAGFRVLFPYLWYVAFLRSPLTLPHFTNAQQAEGLAHLPGYRGHLRDSPRLSTYHQCPRSNSAWRPGRCPRVRPHTVQRDRPLHRLQGPAG